MEKEVYAIYWALLRLDDLVGGVHFTVRTDHYNLLFKNIHGSRNVLQWKLDIQHYDATKEHVAGKDNIPADVLNRLIVRPEPVQLHHVLTLQCTLTQRTLIERFHTHLHTHWGVEKTITLMMQHEPYETDGTNWSPPRRQAVRTELSDMPKDGRQTQNNTTSVTLCAIHS